jgi:hypothetical protein
MQDICWERTCIAIREAERSGEIGRVSRKLIKAVCAAEWTSRDGRLGSPLESEKKGGRR